MLAELSVLPGGGSKSLTSRRHTSYMTSHLAVVGLGSEARYASNMCAGSCACTQMVRYSSGRPPSDAMSSWKRSAEHTMYSPGKAASKPCFSSRALPCMAQNSAGAVPLTHAHAGVRIVPLVSLRAAIAAHSASDSFTACAVPSLKLATMSGGRSRALSTARSTVAWPLAARWSEKRSSAAIGLASGLCCSRDHCE